MKAAMKEFRKYSWQRKTFTVFNYLLLTVLALICLLPMINILAISLSSSSAVSSGEVRFWPVDFTWESYNFVTEKPEFMTAFWVSVKRVLVGVPVNMILTILTAYPLSRTSKQFRGRTAYIWFFFITMLVSGGLVPYYMTILKVGLIDNFWALILPGAVPVYNVIILMNFFRQLPPEIEEAAIMDGASHLQVLFKIMVPLSLPSIATLTLFCIVNHWNSWFEGLLLMNNPANYPLQSYLQTVVVNRDMSLMSTSDILTLSMVSDRTSKAAQTFVAALPVLIIYPFLQRYFTKGIVLGGVKG